jgi:hypothetical protein
MLLYLRQAQGTHSTGSGHGAARLNKMQVGVHLLKAKKLAACSFSTLHFAFYISQARLRHAQGAVLQV